MGLDSVELVLEWENSFDVSLPDDEVAALTTPRQAIDLLCNKLGAVTAVGPCQTLRAYYRVRAGLRHATRQEHLRPALDLPVSSLSRWRERASFWERFRQGSGLSNFRPPLFLFARVTPRDLVQTTCAQHLHQLKGPEEPWTWTWVRYAVRNSITEVVGVKEFSDDDRFIEDIGID